MPETHRQSVLIASSNSSTQTHKNLPLFPTYPPFLSNLHTIKNPPHQIRVRVFNSYQPSLKPINYTMYADQVTAGSKRSVKDRLYGNTDDDYAPRSRNNAKRLRQNDDKWKHDLYKDDEEPQVSNPRAGDLRLKLRKKGLQQASKTEKSSLTGSHRGDLREKLSGNMHTQPANTDVPKEKEVVDVANPARGSVPVEVPTSETKKVTNSTSSRRKSQQKAEVSVNSLLQSLGLEKYLITFQAEEVDMTALMHMNDADLKALGIPMGPRKKIRLALDSRA